MKLLQAHVLEGLKQLADESIDLVVSSPPYWGLRDYGPTAKTVWDGQVDCQHEWTSQKQELQHEARNGLGSEELSPREGKIWHREDASIAGLCLKCGAWQGQLGLEPSFQLFIQHLSTVFQEIKRVLKKSGSVYLNLGDTYAGSWQNYGSREGGQRPKYTEVLNREGNPTSFPVSADAGIPAKCLIGLPWRMALRLIDDGWILRNAIIWHKPNHMPSSVRDRLSNSYEFIFHLVKNRIYYYNLDAIREPHQSLGVPNAIIANTKRETPREYSGKFADTGLQGESRYQVDPEKFNSPRARTQRQRQIKEAHGLNPSGGMATAGLYDQHSLGNPDGKNPGDVLYMKNRPSAGNDLRSKNEDRLNSARGHGGWRGNNLLRVDGKTPDDVTSPEYRDWYLNEREKVGWHEHTDDSTMGLGHQKRLVPHPPNLPHPDGKHPDDVLKIGNHHGSSLTVGRATHYMNQEILPNPNGANPSDFWTITTQPFPEAHFAVFPLGICWNPILSSCPENGTVLDPFAGSGTVAEAVELLNLYGKKPSNEQVRQAREAKTRPLVPAAHRETVLIEINPEYCKIIEKRLSPYAILPTA